MEINEIKQKILYAKGFRQKELKFYKRLFDNFDCKFWTGYTRLGGSKILVLEVNLGVKPKSIDSIVEELRKKGFNFGEKEEEKEYIINNQPYTTHSYEKYSVGKKPGEKDFTYVLTPKNFDINAQIELT